MTYYGSQSTERRTSRLSKADHLRRVRTLRLRILCNTSQPIHLQGTPDGPEGKLRLAETKSTICKCIFKLRSVLRTVSLVWNTVHTPLVLFPSRYANPCFDGVYSFPNPGPGPGSGAHAQPTGNVRRPPIIPSSARSPSADESMYLRITTCTWQDACCNSYAHFVDYQCKSSVYKEGGVGSYLLSPSAFALGLRSRSCCRNAWKWTSYNVQIMSA